MLADVLGDVYVFPRTSMYTKVNMYVCTSLCIHIHIHNRFKNHIYIYICINIHTYMMCM